MKDLFCDSIVHDDEFYHRLLDLRELSLAVDLGLVTPAETSRILRQTDSIVTDISLGQFPYPEIVHAQLACQQLGWD